MRYRSRTAQQFDSNSSTAVLAPKRSKPRRKPEIKQQTPRDRWADGIDWPVVAWISLAHVGLVLAPFYFTWKALGLCAVLVWLTGSVGVCMGYHRCLTHGSFCTYKPIRWLLALCGQLSGEGSALMWVANHRQHQTRMGEADPSDHGPVHTVRPALAGRPRLDLRLAAWLEFLGSQHGRAGRGIELLSGLRSVTHKTSRLARSVETSVTTASLLAGILEIRD